MTGTVTVGNVRSKRAAGHTAVYVGRGSAPQGMEHAQLGNPFRVGREYAQGEAVQAHLEWLRAECRQQGRIYHTVQGLVDRVLAGEHIELVCWCSPKRCHADNIKAAIEGYAARRGAQD